MLEDAIRRALVRADAGYGEITGFRARLQEMDMEYVVGISESTVSVT